MCRLLGIVANKQVRFEFSLLGNPQGDLRTQSEDNPDGWGVAIFPEKGKTNITKMPRKASEDEIFERTAKSGFGRILVAHVRKASSGDNRFENTHPFEADGWVFAHNGTIYNKVELEKYIDLLFVRRLKGDTDSERYFALILSRFAKDKIHSFSTIDALLDSLSSCILTVRDRIGGGWVQFLAF